MSEAPRNSATVTIAGTEYRVSADADPAYIERVAAYVDSTMAAIRERAPFSSSTRLAILTALQIADEMMRERAQRESVMTRVEEKAESLRILLEATDADRQNQNVTPANAAAPRAAQPAGSAPQVVPPRQGTRR